MYFAENRLIGLKSNLGRQLAESGSYVTEPLLNDPFAVPQALQGLFTAGYRTLVQTPENAFGDVFGIDRGDLGQRTHLGRDFDELKKGLHPSTFSPTRSVLAGFSAIGDTGLDSLEQMGGHRIHASNASRFKIGDILKA